MPPVVTLTTDFGTRDAYVAAMKGVILGVCPQATLVDISHEVPPQDVRTGAFLLAEAAPWFPAGTIHLAVVDPGVGSSRRAVAIETQKATLVGPDNGIFARLLCADPMRRAVEITNPRYRRVEVSTTFHGRDLFAPAAAHLACGLDLMELGPAVEELSDLPIPSPRLEPGLALGEVIHVDRFGNLITNLEGHELPEHPSVQVEGGPPVGLCRTYADVAPGSLLALIGSSGFLEISVRDGSAAECLAVGPGARVVVRAS
jgi:S-adenosylmethionine hydrolase